MQIDPNGVYTSSSGLRTPIKDLPYKYLVNIRNKAEQEGDSATVKVVQAEIDTRILP